MSVVVNNKYYTTIVNKKFKNLIIYSFALRRTEKKIKQTKYVLFVGKNIIYWCFINKTVTIYVNLCALLYLVDN